MLRAIVRYHNKVETWLSHSHLRALHRSLWLHLDHGGVLNCIVFSQKIIAIRNPVGCKIKEKFFFKFLSPVDPS